MTETISTYDIWHHRTMGTREGFVWMGSQQGQYAAEALMEWRETNDGDPGRYWVLTRGLYGPEFHGEFDVTAETVWHAERVLPAPDLKPVA